MIAFLVIVLITSHLLIRTVRSGATVIEGVVVVGSTCFPSKRKAITRISRSKNPSAIADRYTNVQI